MYLYHYIIIDVNGAIIDENDCYACSQRELELDLNDLYENCSVIVK